MAIEETYFKLTERMGLPDSKLLLGVLTRVMTPEEGRYRCWTMYGLWSMYYCVLGGGDRNGVCEATGAHSIRVHTSPVESIDISHHVRVFLRMYGHR